MNKPNINLHYKEQDGMLLPDLQISNSNDGSLMEVMHRVQNEATEKIEALTQQMLQQEPMPQTEDILERTRHLNNLKLMAEETVLQTIVLIPR